MFAVPEPFVPVPGVGQTPAGLVVGGDQEGLGEHGANLGEMGLVADAEAHPAHAIMSLSEARPLVAIDQMLHGIGVQLERRRELRRLFRGDAGEVEPEERTGLEKASGDLGVDV